MTRKPLCENACRNHSANYGQGVVKPQCYDNPQEYKVTIRYNDLEVDTLYLCATCKDILKKDAEQHGYSVKYSKRR